LINAFSPVSSRFAPSAKSIARRAFPCNASGVRQHRRLGGGSPSAAEPGTAIVLPTG
jgi:hypothetical protein